MIDRNITELPRGMPPADAFGFYRFFLTEHKRLLALLLASGLALAFADALIPVFIGQLVNLVGSVDRSQALAESGWSLLALLIAISVFRPVVVYVDLRLRNQQLAPHVTSRIRWLSHVFVSRQSWSFFQGDFPGRLAHHVMHTAGALRESSEAAIRAIWYLTVYGGTTIVLLAHSDGRLALPTLLWFAGYAIALWFVVPRLKRSASISSEAYSNLMGRIVDSYSNILILKLFSYTSKNDQFVAEALLSHNAAQLQQMRVVTHFMVCLTLLNTALLVATGGVGLYLWFNHAVEAGAVAMALPLVWQIANTAGWVAWEVAGIFQNIADVREGMKSIAAPNNSLDVSGAASLQVSNGAIEFRNLRFSYHKEQPIFDGFTLAIRAGERIGLVGRSGAGKSTLASLLLRLYAPQAGSILVDGQDIRSVTTDSLRQHIGIVTQDTALLNRSIRDNILCGKPTASRAEIEQALMQSRADQFVFDLHDDSDRIGLDAFVGDRGVKLSGGQRQRIVLARTLLKNAPILILDEATAAVDSEAEQAIQEQLDILMAGKTVLTIAHRLSTLRRMDRIIVLDNGKIIEEGTHDALLLQNGLYADFWKHQTGETLPDSHHGFFRAPPALLNEP